MTDARPDPDELLARLREEAVERPRRGRLRIYLGANAGVGKTFAMLGAAQRERAAGRDLAVGLAVTHGRAETAALLVGLEQLPLRTVERGGTRQEEFDLDGALARRPAVLVLDELAHQNAPGSRHAKRWQDVEELRDAGIEVWTALNVQHLESLNGTVGAITGIRVHETVPDTVLDSAEEVVMVDTTPDELMARLAAGKVYLPKQAERAIRHFFRPGNLVALREIALRRTAEHVEDAVRHWRVESSRQDGAAASAAWDTSGAILCCVGPRDGAEQAVRTAARLAGQLNVRWRAVYVETPRLQRLPAARRDAVLAVLRLAGELGAGTAVLPGQEVAETLVAHAREHNLATLVLGQRAHARRWPWRRGVAARVARLEPGLAVMTAAEAGSRRRLAVRAREDAAPVRWRGYAWALATSLACLVLLQPLAGALELANIVMLMLMAVVLVAWRFGRGPAALAAALQVLTFDFFFVPPRLSFAVSDAQYLVTFAVMLGVGLLVGQLTAASRFQARIANGREQRAHTLFELSRDLASALLAEQVIEIGEAAVRQAFGGDARVLPLDLSDQLQQPADPPGGLDASVADWCLRNAQPAGLGTGTLAANAWHYLPLSAPMRVRGVLACRPAHVRWLQIPEQQQFLATLARQIAIALERVHYVEVAQQALVRMESETLRNALLSAMSHDIRTPLAALVAQAETLRTDAPPALADRVAGIGRSAAQLHALVLKLLDMARLQSGEVTPRSSWQSVEEVVGVALRAAEPALAGQPVRTRLPAEGLPLVEFDPVLMERVLANLLENAAKYGAPPIELGAEATATHLRIRVRDHGPGLPAGVEPAALFDKFTRGASESATPGVGLGLAICRAVVEAHGGRISAADAAGGGAAFTVELPRATPPDLPSPP